MLYICVSQFLVCLINISGPSFPRATVSCNGKEVVKLDFSGYSNTYINNTLNAFKDNPAYKCQLITEGRKGK